MQHSILAISAAPTAVALPQTHPRQSPESYCPSRPAAVGDHSDGVALIALEPDKGELVYFDTVRRRREVKRVSVHFKPGAMAIQGDHAVRRR